MNLSQVFHFKSIKHLTIFIEKEKKNKRNITYDNGEKARFLEIYYMHEIYSSTNKSCNIAI